MTSEKAEVKLLMIKIEELEGIIGLFMTKTLIGFKAEGIP